MRVSDKLKFGFSKTLPLVTQTETSESGLACLAMILGYRGRECTLSELRQRFQVSSKGMSLSYLAEVAEQLKLGARRMRVDLAQLDSLAVPCILQWDFNHFVVLKEAHSDGITIHDPVGEVRTLSLQAVERHFNGMVLELGPGSEFVDASKKSDTAVSAGPQQKFSWSRLLGTTEGLTRSLLEVGILALALELLALLLPLATQMVYDKVVVSGDTHLLTMLGVGMILLHLVRVAINTLRAWSVMIMSATLNLQWIANVFSHLIRLPIPWWDKRHMGDICSRFESIHAIQGMVTTRSIEVGLDGLMSLGTLAMMFIYNPLLTGIVLCIVCTFFLLRMVWFRAERRSTEASVTFASQQQTLFLETLRSVRTIRLFNAAEDRKSRWLNRLVAERNAGLQKQRIGIMTEASYFLLYGAESVAVLWIGALAVLHNQWSIGMMLAFIAYKDQFVQRSIGVVNKIMEFKMLDVQVERLSDIVLTEPEIEHPSRVRTDTLPSTLSVRDVNFRYGEGDRLILNGCNLDVKEGESIAIIGASGCGKTTLLKLMLGMADAESGAIFYGGVPLAQVGTRAYRETIGAVMQDDQLLSGSIAENIAFFTADPDQEWIRHCARVAAIDAEIEAMPLGYHTLVGDMGASLSGGQKQRVLLARALYKRPKILFLDEATSHLDVSNETFVNHAVRELGITTVVIAHRPETIRMADRIFLMEEGRAREVQADILDTLTKRVVATVGVAL